MSSDLTVSLVAYDPTGLAVPLVSVVTLGTSGRIKSDVSTDTVWASTVSAANYIGLPAGGSGNSLLFASAMSYQVTGSAVTVDLTATGVTAGSSYNSLTVDDRGRVTAAQTVAGGGATLPTMSQCSLSADTGTAGIVLANINSTMSFPLTSGKLYRFSAHLIYKTAATTTGFRFGLTCPAFNVLAATGQVPVAAGGVSGVYHSYITASGVSVTGTGVALAGVNYLAELDGTIQPSASGNLVFQYAAEVASRVTCVAGSNAILWTLT